MAAELPLTDINVDILNGSVMNETRTEDKTVSAGILKQFHLCARFISSDVH